MFQQRHSQIEKQWAQRKRKIVKRKKLERASVSTLCDTKEHVTDGTVLTEKTLITNQRMRYIIKTGAWPGLRVLSRIVIGCWETLCNNKFAFYTDKIRDKNTAGLKFIATLAWLNDF